MATTLKDLRRRIARRLSSRFITSKDNGSSTQTGQVVLDSLRSYPSGHFVGNWVRAASGNIYYVRQSENDGSATTLFVYPLSTLATLNGDFGNNKEYEVHAHDPRHYTSYINESLTRMYPNVSIQRMREYPVGGASTTIVDPYFDEWRDDGTSAWWNSDDSRNNNLSQGTFTEYEVGALPAGHRHYIVVKHEDSSASIRIGDGIRTSSYQQPFLQTLRGQTAKFAVVARITDPAETGARLSMQVNYSDDSTGDSGPFRLVEVEDSAHNLADTEWRRFERTVELDDTPIVSLELYIEGSPPGVGHALHIAEFSVSGLTASNLNESQELIIPQSAFPRGISAFYLRRPNDYMWSPITPTVLAVEAPRLSESVYRIMLNPPVLEESTIRAVGAVPVELDEDSADDAHVPADEVAIELLALSCAIAILGSGMMNEETSARLGFLIAERERLTPQLSEPRSPVQLNRDI